jgi:hypothetical protein
MDKLSDDPAFYRTMLRDLHQNGVVLERKKYRWRGGATARSSSGSA